MPLYNNTGPRGQQHWLPLPGPALVIDACTAGRDDMYLLHFLATELENLTEAMRRGHVPQWRHLTECINLLTLAPSSTGAILGSSNPFSAFETHNPLIDTRFFDVGVYNGRKMQLRGKEELAQYLVENHINIVRNSRIQAIQDYDLQAQQANGKVSSPEQSTVRVFFLVDLKDEESFRLAALVAGWLKEWDEEDYGSTRLGRAQRIEVVAICMNAVPQRQYDLLTQVESVTALDTVILIQTYRDDDGYVDDQAQIYQIELILYTFLLYWPSCFEPEFEDTEEESSGVMQMLRQPTYLIGISSLEASVRWGARWLDYNLVAKIIERMHDPQHVQREEQQFPLDDWLGNLKNDVQKIVSGAVQKQLPSLGALEQLRILTANPPSKKHGSLEVLSQDMERFCQQISELYVSDLFRSAGKVTLDQAVRSAALIPAQLKRLYEEVSDHEDNKRNPIVEAYTALAYQQEQAQAFPLKHFMQIHGALPRAQRQIVALTRSIRLASQQALPNLVDYSREFELEAKKARMELERQLKGRRWSFLRRGALQREVEKLYEALCTCVRRHLSYVSEAIAAQVTLTLLEQAGLYEPPGQASPYQRQIGRLDKGLSQAREEALRQSKLAEERLRFGLIEGMNAFSRQKNAFHLMSRNDILEWKSIQDAFLQSYEEMQSDSQQFKNLVRTLVRVSMNETALPNSRGLQQRKGLPVSNDREHFQHLQTELVANLLLANTGNVDPKTMHLLLAEYAQAKQRIHIDPSPLDGEVLNIEDAVRETILALALSSNKSLGPVEKQIMPASEIVLAAWIGSERMRVSALSKIFDDRGVLARIEERKNTLSQVLDELIQQNKLVGYRDERTGDDYFYLFYPQGETSETLQKVLASRHQARFHSVPFPDAEKLIYLHVHRIRQI